MSNHRLINRRTIFFVGLVLLIIGVLGIVYDAARPRFRQKQIPAVIDQVYLVPPQPRAIPVSSPQALPQTGKPRSETQKGSPGANRRAKNHASRVQTRNDAGLETSQNESTSVLDYNTSDQASYNTESQKESLSQPPTAFRQPSQPSSRCTRLTRGEAKKVGIFRGVLNLIKRMLGLKPAPVIFPNEPPTVAFTASATTITMPCSPELHSSSGCPAAASTTVGLTTTASDPDGDTLLYTYTVTGGRIAGEGANVSWDISGVGPGTYTASVEVDDGCGCITASSTTVTIASCPDCVPNVVCPTISSSCPDSVEQGTPITYSANVGWGTPPASSYNWTVSAGTITSGQGTTSITVSTDNLAEQSVTATLEVGGVDPSCGRTTSCTTATKRLPQSSPTPFITPSPQPSPAPTSAMFSKTSSTPTPTPGVQGTPCASPTPAPKDFIEISYPASLLVKNQGEVRVTLSNKNGRSATEQAQPGVFRRFSDWLRVKLGLAPSDSTTRRTSQPFNPSQPPQPDDWCKYDGLAKAELLKPLNLEVEQTEGSENGGFQRLDSNEVLTWAWHVNHDSAADSQLKIRLFFHWKPKVSGFPDEGPKMVWPKDGRAFAISIQEPTIWNLLTSFGSWVSASIGAMLMAIIVGPWLKRQLRQLRRRYTGPATQYVPATEEPTEDRDDTRPNHEEESD
jgi:hypothetical protein